MSIKQLILVAILPISCMALEPIKAKLPSLDAQTVKYQIIQLKKVIASDKARKSDKRSAQEAIKALDNTQG